MKKSYFLLAYILLFNINVMSIENFDECGIFKKTLEENIYLYSFDEPDYVQSSRIYLKYDIETFGLEEGKYLRSITNNLYIDDVPTWVYEEYKIEPGSEIIYINNRSVSELSDTDIDNLLTNIQENKEKLSISIYKEKKITNFEIDYQESLEVFIPLEFEILNISNIDSANSSYTARYRQTFTWSLMDLELILEKIIAKAKEKGIIENNKGLQFYCEYNGDEFNLLNIWQPDALLSNVILEDNDSMYKKYAVLFNYFPPDTEDPNPYFDVTLYKTKISNATFKSKFNYQPFPFDRQILTFNLFDPIGLGFLYFDNASESLKSGFDAIDLYEWNKKSYDIKTFYENDGYGGFSQMISYQIDIERNYIYFLTKIYFPILIILLLSFSTLWINKEELESRLTVSVVCFLALITFTFIIDRDIPKLSYLTSMDLIILISYFFASIPTMNSIYVKRQINKLGYAKDIDNKFRFYLPILYLVLTISIMLFTIVGHPNAVAALRLTI